MILCPEPSDFELLYQWKIGVGPSTLNTTNSNPIIVLDNPLFCLERFQDGVSKYQKGGINKIICIIWFKSVAFGIE